MACGKQIDWSDFFQPITHMIRSTDSFFAQASDWLSSEAETARTGREASRKVECPFFCPFSVVSDDPSVASAFMAAGR